MNVVCVCTLSRASSAVANNLDWRVTQGEVHSARHGTNKGLIYINTTINQANKDAPKCSFGIWVCRYVTIFKSGSTAKLKCAKKMQFLLCAAADTVSRQYTLETCTVDGGSGSVVGIDQAVLNCLH